MLATGHRASRVPMPRGVEGSAWGWERASARARRWGTGGWRAEQQNRAGGGTYLGERAGVVFAANFRLVHTDVL